MKLSQIVLSAASLLHVPVPQKSIAIIGAGSAGLEALRTLLDLPKEVRRDWKISVFESREDIGGVWLPQPKLPEWPDVPATGLYPELRTNTLLPISK